MQSGTFMCVCGRLVGIIRRAREVRFLMQTLSFFSEGLESKPRSSFMWDQCCTSELPSQSYTMLLDLHSGCTDVLGLGQPYKL